MAADYHWVAARISTLSSREQVAHPVKMYGTANFNNPLNELISACLVRIS
jgi:hypothetical protein